MENPGEPLTDLPLPQPTRNGRYLLIAFGVIPVASILLFCAVFNYLFGCDYELRAPKVSPDDNAIVEVGSSSCGGAVGSTITRVILDDRTGYSFLPRRFRTDTVFAINSSGVDDVKVTWVSATELNVRYLRRDWARVTHQKTSWKHVTITYEPVEYQWP